MNQLIILRFSSDYEYEDAILVVKEMVELNVLRLVESRLVTNHISLYIGYSRTDGGGWAGGSRKLTVRTNSLSVLMDAFISLYHLKRKTDQTDFYILWRCLR